MALSSKPRIVAANKIDALDEPERLDALRAHVEALGVAVYPVSAVTGEGMPALARSHVARGRART